MVPDHPIYTFENGNVVSPIRPPFRMGVIGKSGSGKSYAIERMIQELPVWFGNTFTCVYYLHPDSGGKLAGIRAQHVARLREACDKYNVDFRDITTDPDKFLKTLEEEEITPRLCIIDDLAVSLFQSEEGYEAFTRTSHHCQLSFIVTCQNLYAPGKYGVTIRRSFTDLLIFLDLGDKPNQDTMSYQLFGNRRFLNSCLAWLNKFVKKSTDRFVLIDQNNISPLTPPSHFEKFSVRTCIFPDENNVRRIVYLTPPKAK